jgi:Tfp pilus assembly PilM family ATPase
MSIAAILFGLGLILGIRYLYFYFTGDGSGHIQSVILAGVLMGMGFQTGLIAFIADLLSVNRKLLEELRVEQMKASLEKDDK